MSDVTLRKDKPNINDYFSFSVSLLEEFHKWMTH